MRVKLNSFSFILIADTIIIILSCIGIYRIKDKADLPLKFSSAGPYLIIKEVKLNKPLFQTGDTVLSINGKRFTSQEEIEVFLDGFKPGSPVQIEYFKSGKINISNLRLVKFYSGFYFLTALITGLIFTFIGIFVLWKKPAYKPAKIFNLVTVSTASIIMMTWGNYNIPPSAVDYILRIMFSVSYSFAPALFVYFTLIFPREKYVPVSATAFLFAAATIISILSSTYFIRAISLRRLAAIQNYLAVFNYSRMFLAGCIISGLIIFIHTYITSINIPEKKKLSWILSGFFLGPLLFACLWVIPQAFTNYGLVPEEFVVILMLFIPVTFAVAILRYHIFNIDLIIERSVIYFLSVGILILVYALVISILMHFVKNINEFLPSGIAAVITALLFHPAKDGIQKFIAKKFFRVRYDFRIASGKFLNEIKNCSNVKSLAEKILGQIKTLLPVEKQAFFIYNKENSRLYLKAEENFEILKERSVFLNRDKLKTSLPQPVGLKDKIEPGSQVENADIKVFKKWGIALVFPIKSNKDDLLGFLVLGEKKSGARFTIEDLDLLIEVSIQAGLTIERIQIQEELIREQLQKEQFRELNDLKSFFISSVSHELKTPLTSIKMFTEFLHINENLEKEKKEEYFEIIEGECSRLGRLIENVLDLSKMERGAMEYHFKDIDVKNMLRHAVDLMSYQMKMEKCEVVADFDEEECNLHGDPDLLMSAVLNLLSNGIKYSSIPKCVIVSITKDESYVNLNFKNNGKFIAPGEMLKIIKPYYRSGSAIKQKIPGSGIGLTLVNQIMSAHYGKLLITNTSGNGCIFTLSFPREK